ncbi:two-component system histidine kinase PnpS [Natronincola ferrireducens]|uniref:histidine kinase n=1 Tax=Natronincola ferrireducens TaxID=393762 RepID=A0A1G9BPW9_9FIRM|nr:ATP-binding protein [Natronincola ferrireducens]SDK41194.1 PAS/PAC sensor signal transduction histidine kinase [Natronincola ferrireducens]
MQKKIFVIFFVILLVGILLTGFLSLSLIRSSYIQQLEQKLISNGRLIEEFIIANDLQLLSQQFQQKMEDLGDQIDARITIVDSKGMVLVETFKHEGYIENHRDRPEIQRAYDGEIGKTIRYSSTVDLDMLYVALPVQLEKEIIVVRLAVNLLEIKKINQTLFYYIAMSIACGLIISTLIGYRFIDKIMDPIKEITEASKKMALGRLGVRTHVTSKDEIGELANHFNHMADRLEETIEKLSDSNTKFKGLLTSIINPIVAIDNKKNILLLNAAAEKLFNIKAKDAIGKHILEVVRNNQLDEEIERVFNNNIETQIEINMKDPIDKILKVYTNLIKLENDPTKMIGLVALMEDVTEIRKLEKIRSDFVANVSHELKTPLTSISGFVETLKSGAIEDEDTKNRFLDIIDIETQRLARLIDDILTLSEIESSQHKMLNQQILSSEVLKEVEEMMEPIASNKEIQLTFTIDTNLPMIYGNRDWFKQMFINLIDNAIKYTLSGGKVQLTAYKKYNNIIISVKDTGIGIPKKDIPRLFERFYRVDKARSRKVGGTGLGLAIVKHIVLSLKGKIRVNSEQGKGTEFTVIIPIEG